jgi:hypothetical protein
MSSDADYAAFLDKANQDTSSAQSQSQSQSKKLGTKAVDTDVPAELKNVDVYYESDADEPFEAVSLKFKDGELPGESEFAKLIGHSSHNDVSKISAQDFDPKNKYKKVLDAVKKAAGGGGSGDVGVYKVEHGSTRAEYYVVSVDKKEERLVGLKALAVES